MTLFGKKTIRNTVTAEGVDTAPLDHYRFVDRHCPFNLCFN